MFKVLVMPAGTENGLEIGYSLLNIRGIEVHGAAYQKCHAHFVFRFMHFLPGITSDCGSWLGLLNDIVLKNKIDLIFPTHDETIVHLARYRKEILCPLDLPSTEICELSRSKKATYKRLSKIVPTPRVFNSGSGDIPQIVFAKPDRGEGSKGALKIETKEEANKYIKDESYIVTEYLAGEEFTIDCFSDKGRLVVCSPRKRNRMRNGIAVNTNTESDPLFEDLAQSISSELIMDGPWFFQVKDRGDGVKVLLEIAPRVSGSMCLARAIGYNIPLMSIYKAQGLDVSRPISNLQNIEVDRALQNRYKINLSFKQVVVDLDDTLIFEKRINGPLVGYLFEQAALGKKIKLVTRHSKDVQQTLGEFRLAGLFDEIVHLKLNEPKSLYCNNESIFIDDAFSERKEVSSKLGIPCFGIDNLEVLLNSRVCLFTDT